MTSTGRAGRYRLEEVIGVGSFATVHRAVDDRLEDVVVVKILAENHSLNPEIRERFIAEGRALRKVDSPHVVTVHDIGEGERQQPYLVLELADRGTLAERVGDLRRRGWTATAEDVVVVARQLAAAVEAIHHAQLVHRDLSPANVLITGANDLIGQGATANPKQGVVVRQDERLLVADLGMCKDLALNSGLTVAGGTAGFRPPEMDVGPALIDTRADLWSLSSLMAWLCEGADLPDALTQTLDRGRAVDPEDRHPDVAAWLVAVEAALAPPAPAGTTTTSRSSQEGVAGPADASARGRPATSARRPVLPVLALVVGALLLGLLGGWLVARAGGPGEATTTARIEIEGPDTVMVGEPATFTLRHLGVSSWVWVLPTGQHVADQESITLTPSGPGASTVTVRARDASGADLQDDVRLTVTQ